MKIVGISCSPRKGESTYQSLKLSFDEVQKVYPEIKTEIIDLGGLKINGCIDCKFCKKELNCSQKDDFIDIIPKLTDPEIKGIIIATPVYLGSMTALCKAFLERSVMFRRNGKLFKDKVATVITIGAVRSGGQEMTIQQVQAALLCHDMIIVGDGNDTAHYGGAVWSGMEGGIENDTIGLKTAFNAVKRVAEVINKTNNNI